MKELNQTAPAVGRRVEQNLKKLVGGSGSIQEISGRVAGTSEETAALFGTGVPATSPPVIGSEMIPPEEKTS
jgi:hypothetical protein